MKKPEGKPQMSLMYTSFIEEVVRVREYGIEKHGDPEGWQTTTTIEHMDSALRHLLAYKSWLLGESIGEQNDPESGHNHLAMAACNLMFEIERLSGTLNNQICDSLHPPHFYVPKEEKDEKK